MYPDFQRYLRERKPHVLVVWGKNDVSFIPSGPEAFKRDVPDVEIHLVEAGHFALAGVEETFAEMISDFLGRKL